MTSCQGSPKEPCIPPAQLCAFCYEAFLKAEAERVIDEHADVTRIPDDELHCPMR